jgi:preprotein translocase subunit SecE
MLSTLLIVVVMTIFMSAFRISPYGYRLGLNASHAIGPVIIVLFFVSFASGFLEV